ncbi:pol [Symbiodinium necroappetens]|uniref:Pol protein n=1 Tax=Symbiodinium necroappetens TaxID=1628268 RepID=A0A812ZX49_9DINO|nr:pol [Symbiodinium necroappetens]
MERRTNAYKDPEEVKRAFRQAKLLKTGTAWKNALSMRKKARKAWEAMRLEKASRGDWGSLRSCRPKKNAGWDVTFAAAQQGDPHEAVHRHLAEVYQGVPPDVNDFKFEGEVCAFTLQEMREALAQLKAQKAVGSDYTSQELLVGVMTVQGGKSICGWAYKVQTVKTACYGQLGTLLPVPLLSALHPADRRQTFYSVDLNKAFDCVDRRQLLRKLGERMGPCAEMGCWAALMSEVTGVLQTPWGSSLLSMPSGIKQGAVESPSMFGFLAETALEETRVRHKWADHAKLLEGLDEEECIYMDDGCFWSRGVALMQAKIREYAQQLQKYGLSINLAKCQLYCAPRCSGARLIRLGEAVLEASPHLEVMGLQFKVGVTTMELLTPLATKARNRFWEIRHILCSKGGLSKRIRTMQRTAAQAGLWCLSALPPDPGGLGYLNSVQIQLIVWMMRIGGLSDFEFGGLLGQLCTGLDKNDGLRCGCGSTGGTRGIGLVGREFPVLSSIIDSFRDKQWWETEKLKPTGQGVRHVRHFAKLMQMEGKLNLVAGGPWRLLARDRRAWAGKEDEWVAKEDLPWASGARGQGCDAVCDCCLLGRIHSDCSRDLLSPLNPLNMGVVTMFFTWFPYVAALSACLWGPLMGVSSQATSIPLCSMALLTSAGAWMDDAPRPLPVSVHLGADRREHQAPNQVDRTILPVQTVDREHVAPDHFDYTIHPGQTELGEGIGEPGVQFAGNATEVNEWVQSVRLLEDWFVEGRATQLALGMLVAGIHARGWDDYVAWTGTSVRWLSQWAPGFDGLACPEVTPPVFHSWGLEVELQLWRQYAEGADSDSSGSSATPGLLSRKTAGAHSEAEDAWRCLRKTLEMLLDKGDAVPEAPSEAQAVTMLVTEWVDFVLQGWLQMAGESSLEMVAPCTFQGPPAPLPAAVGSGCNGSQSGRLCLDTTPVQAWQRLMREHPLEVTPLATLAGPSPLPEGGLGSLGSTSEASTGGATPGSVMVASVRSPTRSRSPRRSREDAESDADDEPASLLTLYGSHFRSQEEDDTLVLMDAGNGRGDYFRHRVREAEKEVNEPRGQLGQSAQKGWAVGRRVKMQAGHDVVAAGQPLLPEYVQAMIVETIANYDLTDRSVMTASFVAFLRMLMSEVMVAFERGVTAGVARERDEILVDVVVEDEQHGGDGTSLMQRTLTGQFRDTSASRWTRTLQGLQNDLSAQPVPLRNANIAGLLARLSSAMDIQAGHREPLLALLVGMQECDCTEAAVGDVGWQVSWWGRVYTALRLEAQEQAAPSAPSSSLDAPSAEDLQAMAADEAEVREERLREQEARQRQEEEHDREEEEYLRTQANLLAAGQRNARGEEEGPPVPAVAAPARLSAQALRAWEDWEWHNLLQEPPKQRRRTVLTVTVGGSQSSGGPWLSRTLRLPCPRPAAGVGLRVDMAFEEEVCPDDVETLVLPAATRFADHGGQAASLDMSHGAAPGSPPPISSAPPLADRESLPTTAETQMCDEQVEDGVAAEGTLSDVAWSDYEGLYGKWKSGVIDDAAVILAGGRNLLDLMQTQYVLDLEDTQGVLVTSTSTTTLTAPSYASTLPELLY